LAAIYLLDPPGSGAGSSTVERLYGVAAAEALVANTYRGAYIQVMGGTQQHLLQCLRLVNEVPVFKLSRVWGFDAFEEQAKLLESHAREVALAKV
jgi:hypothetical protein